MAFMDLDSRVLAGAWLVEGRSVWLGDKVIIPRPALALTARRFRLTSGDMEEALEIEGYTTEQPPYRDPDVRTATLHLEGQRFFDRTHSSDPVEVLALVGGPPAAPPTGFAGYFAHVVSGPRQGEPVRPFALEGADRALGRAVHHFAGWKNHMNPEVVQQVIDAGHPLIAVDALRICAGGECGMVEFERLAAHLLHPSETPEAKAIALELVARKLKSQTPGSLNADALVTLTWRAWQFERQYRIGEAYLQVWAGAPEQVKRHPNSRELIAMALDDTATERIRSLRSRLRESLNAGSETDA